MYRVDNVPRIWRPLWLAYSWIAGGGAWLVAMLLNMTCRISLEGTQNFGDGPNCIYSLWHRFWFLWFVTFVRSHRRHVWLQHPAAYMKPVHIALRLMGVRVLLGSWGEEGRQAAERLAEMLRSGWSTAISPDGPHGPEGVLRKGVLYLSLESGVPVLPVRFAASHAIALPSWDRKSVPLPFSRIRVFFEEPITVTEDNFGESGRVLADKMSGN